MSHPQLSILIPAAGASRRLGQPKQLVRHQTSTLIQHAVDIALSVGPQEVIVVTGANEKAVRGAVKHGQVRWIHNSNWSDGMGSSIAAGSAVISPEAHGVMIFHCDQWRLETSDLLLMAETWQSNPDRIIGAKAKGQIMPPVIFPFSLFVHLQALEGDRGAKNILRKHPGMLTTLSLKNAVFDLDTQTDLNHAKSHKL